ncbi:uridine kinase family protein [Pontiella agarivorans]|uniref:Nucleoside kinase n=1 Tax=Pontiella agarivorans TaxID=3038953 RepID=A0ABU5MYQ9_9BACT|nr:nucleoside kinase [Pontiella agarivorans]MDZ8119325.1 nucleoside kinase [Pontiella agarivorans]
MLIETAEQLNDAIGNGRAAEYIEQEESRLLREVERIADRITEKNHALKWVWLAGPSSSGKTTFTRMLGSALHRRGIKTHAISLDNYFVNRELTPKNSDGEYDYEHLEAVDLSLLERHLDELGRGKTIELPHFKFLHGRREFRGKLLNLQSDELALIEGIHGLNPRLTSFVNPLHSFKIYICARTALKQDRNARISTTDNRLLRRMIRDFNYRGHTVAKTFTLWPAVRAGENQWIFPFQPLADLEFNSALGYELSVLKPLAESLIRQLPASHPGHKKAQELMQLLSKFQPLEKSMVPKNSILQEFIESPD